VRGGRPRRVLVHAAGELGDCLAGPEIRALEFAKALNSEYEVTLAAQRPSAGERDGIPVVPSTRRQLILETQRHDAVLSACPPPYLLALRPLVGRPLVIADLYDPHEQELATLEGEQERTRALRTRATIQALHLRHSDRVLCASETQREELLGLARTLGSPRTDPVVVPFGLPDPPAPTGRQPLRERFPQLGEQDTVVLWWGTPWRWLDAETPVRAFARIAASRPDLKLVITAGRPKNAQAERRFDVSEEIRLLASELGVLDRTVLFLDEWIPYEQRYDFLREADIGLTLHRHAEEARLAVRSRYMDYLSAGLPCVLGRGDETAEELGAAGFATLLEDPDPAALATALVGLADDPRAMNRARAAAQTLAAQRNWSAAGARLREVVAGAFAQLDSPRAPALSSLAGAGAFYTRRLADRIAAAR
jgi:glycosyltransferase involved in cell wall biosynthesis